MSNKHDAIAANIITEETINILKNFGIDINFDKPGILASDEILNHKQLFSVRYYVCTSIEISRSLVGRIYLGFSKDLASKVAAIMCGQPCEDISSDEMAMSALEELINQIVGNSKLAFEKNNLSIDMGLPELMLGAENLNIRLPSSLQNIVELKFKLKNTEEEFSVLMAVKRNEQQ